MRLPPIIVNIDDYEAFAAEVRRRAEKPVMQNEEIRKAFIQLAKDGRLSSFLSDKKIKKLIDGLTYCSVVDILTARHMVLLEMALLREQARERERE